MRKSFKVATAFTGAAACAAGFAPAAGAATAQPATSHYNCAANVYTTSTVLYWPASKHHGPTCVGGANYYRSPTNLGDNYFTYFCAGNNWGYITFPNRATRYYGPGRGYGTLDDNVRSVSIYSWSGTDTCFT